MGLSIELRKIAELKPRANNPRIHSKRQLSQMGASITRFGFTNPVLIDVDDQLIAGHGRLAAAQMLGMVEVPTIRLCNMSEANIRAYVIADNKLAERASWSEELLKSELVYLSELEDVFDLTLTGFELPEIDVILSGKSANVDKPDRADILPPASTSRTVTRSGDIWEIGKHRLICGDATKPATYQKLMSDKKAGMIFSDAPYNVPIAGHVSGLGKAQHAEFAMASGEMSKDEYKNFLAKAFVNQAKVSMDGSIHFQCIDWRHLEEMLAAGDVGYRELKNICVWSKLGGGMGSLYRSAHELVFVFKSGTAAHKNNVELGKHGRYRTNVWEYRGANSFGATRTDDLAMHPTVKPVAMVADAILDCSDRGDIVLDAFAGSGTTLVAAHKTKRRGYGIEIDPAYCDTIVTRMRTLFKLEARLAGDGRTFDEVGASRVSDAELEEVV
ncbi:site-specific DNA-methyltransferase [Novosphingobium sp.]|uniref:site-specific DNA-methyltransferase n=1 Tax=Novosphingobium sp. TaxID=1874826 RepID=UPI003D096909